MTTIVGVLRAIALSTPDQSSRSALLALLGETSECAHERLHTSAWLTAYERGLQTIVLAIDVCQPQATKGHSLRAVALTTNDVFTRDALLLLIEETGSAARAELMSSCWEDHLLPEQDVAGIVLFETPIRYF